MMAADPMAGDSPTNSNTPLVAIISTVVIVAVVICAGFFFKSSVLSGSVPPQTTGRSKLPPSIPGHYVGYTTLQTGICSVGAHELVIDIDQDGAARSNYDMKPGDTLTGRPNADGRLKMNFHGGDLTVRFEGEVKAGRITGRTYVSGDETCNIYWDLTKG
jgi:hypothetical protein